MDNTQQTIDLSVLNSLRTLLVICSFAIQSVWGSAGFAAEYMDTPLVVVSVASIQSLEEDLARIGEVSGNRKPVSQFQKLKKQLEQFPGIDQQRAVGGMVVLESTKLEPPTFVAMVPMTDGEKFIAAFKEKVPIVQTIRSGSWKINIPEKPLYAKLRESYLVVSPKRQVLDLATSQVLQKLTVQTESNDFSVTLSMSGLSTPVRERIVEGFNKEIEKDRFPKEGESDSEYALRKELLEVIRLTATQFFQDTEEIRLMGQFESDISLQAEINVLEGSELSGILAGMKRQEKRILDAAESERPVRLQYSMNVPQPFRKLAMNILKQVRKDVRRDIGPHLAEADRMPISGAFDAIQKSIETGALDGLVEFQEVHDTQMVLVGGTAVEGKNLLETSLETILPYARDSKDITEVEMNVVNDDHLRLHRLQGKEPRDDDRRLYGDDLSLYVGTGNQSIWLAVGGGQTPERIKQLSEHKTESSEALVKIDFSLDPWLRLGEKHQRDMKKVERFRQAFPDSKADRLQFEIHSSEKGVSANLHAEAGYLKLLGLAMENE